MNNKLIHVDTIIDGRKTRVLAIEGDPNPEFGIVVGPPDLSGLNLPEEIEIKLHNELFVRGIITQQDALRRREEILAALQAALLLNVDKIVRCYSG